MSVTSGILGVAVGRGGHRGRVRLTALHMARLLKVDPTHCLDDLKFQRYGLSGCGASLHNPTRQSRANARGR
jgi:hypothetical protein